MSKVARRLLVVSRMINAADIFLCDVYPRHSLRANFQQIYFILRAAMFFVPLPLSRLRVLLYIHSLLFSDVTIGFEEVEYTTSETDATMEVCIVKTGQSALNLRIVYGTEEIPDAPNRAVGEEVYMYTHTHTHTQHITYAHTHNTHTHTHTHTHDTSHTHTHTMHTYIIIHTHPYTCIQFVTSNTIPSPPLTPSSTPSPPLPYLPSPHPLPPSPPLPFPPLPPLPPHLSSPLLPSPSLPSSPLPSPSLPYLLLSFPLILY